MKTRTTTKKAPAESAQSDDLSQKQSGLPPSSSNPPLLLVLPKEASSTARIVTLPNPATSTSARYLFCPEQGLYEFTNVTAPKQTPRSWLLAPNSTSPQVHTDDDQPPTDHVSRGYAIQDAPLFVATPLDPLFLLLPALVPKSDQTRQMFLSIHDHLDTLAENSPHLNQFLHQDKLCRTFETRAHAVCDSVDAGDEAMYRLSTPKLLDELLRKAKKMVNHTLPPSIEQHFVQDALKLPVMAVLREDSFEAPQPDPEQPESTEALPTDPLPADPPPTEPSVPQEIQNLLRIRTAFNFILSSYISPTLRTSLSTLLANPDCAIDFQPLDAHLDKIAQFKKEQHALRSLSDNISRKRVGADDDEAEERAEKRRKKEEEEKKKKLNQSRGVKQLAKVNTTGMQKMSSFFTKAPAKKKT